MNRVIDITTILHERMKYRLMMNIKDEMKQHETLFTNAGDALFVGAEIRRINPDCHGYQVEPIRA